MAPTHVCVILMGLSWAWHSSRIVLMGLGSVTTASRRLCFMMCCMQVYAARPSHTTSSLECYLLVAWSSRRRGVVEVAAVASSQMRSFM